MQKYVARTILFGKRHLVLFCTLALALLLLVPASALAVEERSIISRLWIGAASFAGGATAGGIAGAFVGGIGIAAMGTAIGVPVLAVAGIGALVGGVSVGFVGLGGGILLWALDPDRYAVNWPRLAMIFIFCLVLSWLVVSQVRCLYSRLRRAKNDAELR